MDELVELQALIKELESILKSKAKLRKQSRFGDATARAQGATPMTDARAFTVDTQARIDVLDLIEDEEVVVVLTNNGYIKTVAADAFRRQGRGGRGVEGSRAPRR